MQNSGNTYVIKFWMFYFTLSLFKSLNTKSRKTIV